MFQRQYEDDAEILGADGAVVASGYARLVLRSEDEGTSWGGTFRVREAAAPPLLDGEPLLRLRNGREGAVRLTATEDVQGEVAGRAGTFFEVTGVGPAPF